jgi:Plasmid pRiA4b ORF-3-like protein
MGEIGKVRRTKPRMSAMTGFESYNEICAVRIELLETEPLIWREVEVPTSVTLKVLHDVIQITVPLNRMGPYGAVLRLSGSATVWE